MGKKSTPQAPPAPDPVAMANAQGTANKDTAIAQARLNAVDSNSPFGNVTYTESPGSDPSVPKFTQNVQFSPDQQRLYDTQKGVEQKAYDTAATGIGNAQNVLNAPFSLNNLPALQTSAGNVPAPKYGYDAVNPLFGIAPAGNIQQRIDTSNLPGLPGVNDFSAERKNVEDAYLGRFNEDIGRNEEATISRLNAEGLQRGSEAYGTATNQIDRQRNDARNLAIQAGGAEQSRLFGLASQARGQMFGENQAAGQFANEAQGQQFSQNAARTSAYNQAAQQQTFNNQGQMGAYNSAQAQQFGQGLQNASLNNQGRQQSIAEQQLLRNQPINEIATLLGLGSGIQTPTGAPNFGVNFGQTDVLGAYGLQQQALQNQYNQQMQSSNAMWGALGNLAGSAGSAAILASDARVKNIARRVGQTTSGIPLYLFAYKATPERLVVGPIAQEVRRVNPLAVHNIKGVLHVDYREVA